MAHELTIRENGKVEMAYVEGTYRWHGLGDGLPPGASQAEWEKAAGYDWRISRSKIRFATDRDSKNIAVFPDKHVLFRSDNKLGLSIVSAAYNIVQPKDVLNYFHELSEKAGFTMRTAGTLYGGKRFWALADMGEDTIVLDPQDKVKGRLLMATSCDGSMATTLKFIKECVVCQNTLSAGLAENGHQVRVLHSTKFDPKKVNEKLGIQMREDFEKSMILFRQLAETDMTEEIMALTTAQLIHGDAVKEMSLEDLIEAANHRVVKRIGQLALTGEGLIGGDLQGRRGTAWAWLNAVTQYTDHEGGTTDLDRRLDKAMFGTGDYLKNQAEALACTFLPGGEAYKDEVKGSLVADKILGNV
jgi:phage/plasmid-like protein (TIGR03299 family)